MSQSFVLHREQLLAAPLDEVFPFFANPENLERITPAFLGFKILTPRPISMQVGQRIDYKIRLRGLPLRWTSEITAYEPPHRFVDKQLRGPYRVWEHEHRFFTEGSATRVVDRIVYSVFGGSLVERFLVRPDLERIFEYRRNCLDREFGEIMEERILTA